MIQEKEDHFLEHLRSELALENPEEAKPMVRSVLHALRQTVSRANAEKLVAILPDFLTKYFTESGREEKEVSIEHLDELVVLVMEEDKKENAPRFKSEVQTLGVIVYTLRNIFRAIDPSKDNGITYPFYQEVREASLFDL